ncbi:MAG: chemotaxis protein [Parafilimonas terrae]|nr:chemotaxis protein [Parafilimonas terrae]
MSSLNRSARPDEAETFTSGTPSAAVLVEGAPGYEAGAIAAAMQVFEDGLAHLMTRRPDAVVSNAGCAEDVTGLLAAIASQTSLMALRASIESTHDGAAGRGFAAAAADVRSLARQMARATDTLVSQVGQIQAAAERAQDAFAAERRGRANSVAA